MMKLIHTLNNKGLNPFSLKERIPVHILVRKVRGLEVSQLDKIYDFI
ncbi:MAG: hypothetical protein ACI92E_000918 [Oceanicoccus sp.]|jgi:hypothetical protein